MRTRDLHNAEMHLRRDFKAADPSWDAAEGRWMRQLAAGDPDAESAWASLFTAYGRLFVKRLAFNGVAIDQVQELAQDLWMEVLRAAPRWRGEAPVRHFLYVLLRDSSARHFKQRERLPKVDSLSEDNAFGEADTTEVEAAMALLAHSSATQDEWFDFIRCVRGALIEFEKAHPHLASLLLLRHVEELSLEEIAKQVGGDAELAKSQVFSAREKFRPKVRPCLDLWPNRKRGEDEHG
jgi:RNA polymerase sigma factor (sigma-70 family)